MIVEALEKEGEREGSVRPMMTITACDDDEAGLMMLGRTTVMTVMMMTMSADVLERESQGYRW